MVRVYLKPRTSWISQKNICQFFLVGRSSPSRLGPRTVRPPPTLSRHTGDAESSSRRTPWNCLGCRYGLSGRLRLITVTPIIWWKYQCFHLMIMGVALDVHVSQAHWQQLKNMSADALIGSIISFRRFATRPFQRRRRRASPDPSGYR